MEQTNLLSGCWLQQKKAFIDNLLISRKRPTIDSVHDIRVAVKKIRSYLRLKKQLKGDEWKGSFVNIATLYKSFGIVADYDMSIAILRRMDHKKPVVFSFFKETLFVNRSLSRKRTRQDAIKFNEKDLDAFDNQFTLELSNEKLCEKIIELSVLKIKNVKELMKHFRKNAHKIRKLLKDVYNWVKIDPKYFDKDFISIRALDQMLKYLGSWQDHFVFRKKITQFITDSPENADNSNLKTLGRKLKPVQDEFLEKAKHKWKGVMRE